MNNDAGGKSALGEGLGLVDKLRNPWHHADCRRAADEIERLTKALKAANDQAERFERGWYLRGDALESIKRHCEPQPSALAAAIVATCKSGLEA